MIRHVFKNGIYKENLPVLFNIQYFIEIPLFFITEIIPLSRDLYNLLIPFCLNCYHSSNLNTYRVDLQLTMRGENASHVLSLVPPQDSNYLPS